MKKLCGIFMTYIKLTARNQRSSGFYLLNYMLWSPNGRNAFTIRPIYQSFFVWLSWLREDIFLR